MLSIQFDLVVEGETAGLASATAGALATRVREIQGVTRVTTPREEDQITQDLGTIVSVVASAAATTVIARGLAAWLRGRRSTRLKIVLKSESASLKIEVDKIDPEAAKRITEIIAR